VEAVASSNSSGGCRRYAQCGAATDDPCRSQTPSKWCFLWWRDRSSRVLSRSTGADQTQAAARRDARPSRLTLAQGLGYGGGQ
jgi:hypothetical protein